MSSLRHVREILKETGLVSSLHRIAKRPDFEVWRVEENVGLPAPVIVAYFIDNISTAEPFPEPLLTFLPKDFYGDHVRVFTKPADIVKEAAMRRRAERGYRSGYIVSDFIE